MVLGMHRSGTSSVAELISRAGFVVPGDPLETIDEVNAHGFWESAQVVDFNEAVLTAADASWFTLQPREVQATQGEQKKMLAWLQEMLARHRQLVIKDPRLCILLPVWLPLLEQLEAEIQFVFVNRFPDFVSASLERRDGFSLETGFALWIKYCWQSLSHLQSRVCYFVNYEDLLVDRSQSVSLLNWLRVESAGEVAKGVIDQTLARNTQRFESLGNPVVALARRIHQVIASWSGCRVINVTPLKEIFENNVFFGQYELLVSFLDDANVRLVNARRKMMENGRLYELSVAVIEQKDLAIEENARHIQRCHGELETMRERLQVQAAADIERQQHLDARAQELEEALDRERQAVGYIDKCHLRIAELDAIVIEHEACEKSLVEWRERFDRENEALLVTQDRERQAVDYIEKCHHRIAEQDKALAEYEECRRAAQHWETRFYAESAALAEVVVREETLIADLERCHSQRAEQAQQLQALFGVRQELQDWQQRYRSLADNLRQAWDREKIATEVVKRNQQQLAVFRNALGAADTQLLRYQQMLLQSEKNFGYLQQQYLDCQLELMQATTEMAAVGDLLDTQATCLSVADLPGSDLPLASLIRQLLIDRLALIHRVNGLVTALSQCRAEMAAHGREKSYLLSHTTLGFFNRKALARINNND